MKALIALLALAMLAGCAISPPDDKLAYRSGTGVVQAVQPGRVELPRPGSGVVAGWETAGGGYGSMVERLFRARWTEQLTLKMDDGATQKVTQDSGAFKEGDRVEVTSDGRVVKTPSVATSPPTGITAPMETPALATSPPTTITAPARAPAPSSAKPAAGPRPAPAAKAASKSYRPGLGIVESASVLSGPSSPSASSGGATAPRMAYRLKMLDGTTQEILQTGDRFQVGGEFALVLGALEERSARAREQHHVGPKVGEHRDRSAGRVLHVGEACWRHSRQIGRASCRERVYSGV